MITKNELNLKIAGLNERYDGQSSQLASLATQVVKAFDGLDELEQKLTALEARLEETIEALNKSEDKLTGYEDRLKEYENKLAEHEEKLTHVNEYVKELFDDAVAETAKKWDRGLEAVINFNPYGANNG